MADQKCIDFSHFSNMIMWHIDRLHVQCRLHLWCFLLKIFAPWSLIRLLSIIADQKCIQFSDHFQRWSCNISIDSKYNTHSNVNVDFEKFYFPISLGSIISDQKCIDF